MQYTFENFNEDIDKIVYQIKSTGMQYDYIVGLVRGGSIPAVVLSHRLDDAPEVVMLSWSHRDDRKEHNAWIPEMIRDGKKVLVVDDIVDSGRSIKEILDDWQIPREFVDIAALVYNTSQDVKVNFYGRTIDRNIDKQWLNFWWEQ